MLDTPPTPASLDKADKGHRSWAIAAAAALVVAALVLRGRSFAKWTDVVPAGLAPPPPDLRTAQEHQSSVAGTALQEHHAAEPAPEVLPEGPAACRAPAVSAWDGAAAWLSSAPPPPDQLVLGSAALATALPAEVLEFYDERPDMHRDAPGAYAKEGGDKSAQIYGEVTPSGMYKMLSHAMCLASKQELPDRKALNPPEKDCTDGVDDATFRQLAPGYRFFDLGSGTGKFPVAAALMGFQSAKGIELDSTRWETSSKHLAAVLAKYPCLDGKLTTVHDSFVKQVDWTKGKEPRVIFLDAVFFGAFWPQVQELMKKAEWGAGSVVIDVGREFLEADSGLKQVSQGEFEVSWSPASGARFYERANTEPEQALALETAPAAAT